MKKLIFVLVALSIVFGGTVFAAEKELKVFIWSEYMDEENMPKDFEAATGIKVRLDLYESNEDMMAKLQAGGVAQYDLIVPSDYIMPSLINLKLIQPLDHSKIPNLKNLGTKFQETTFDPGNKYSVGYQWGTVGLMYRKDRIKADDVKSWAILFDPKKDPGPFALIDSGK
jgi:spermidine/putrescine transport system substrate-binding protein